MKREDLIDELRRPLDLAYRECSLDARAVARSMVESLGAVAKMRITVPSEVDPEELGEGWRVVAFGYRNKGKPDQVITHTVIESVDPDFEVRLKAVEKLTRDLGLRVSEDGGGRSTDIHIHTHIPEPKGLPKVFTNEKLLEAVQGKGQDRGTK